MAMMETEEGNTTATTALVPVPIPALQDAGDSGLFVCSGAFSFFGDGPVDTNDVAIAVTFNLALTYHFAGMQHYNVGLFEKACRLYHLCGVEMMPCSSFLDENPIGWFVSMACLNNQAQIQFQYLGGQAAAVELSEPLDDLCIHVLFSQSEEGSRRHLTKLIEEIMLNIQMFKNLVSCAAGAA